MKKWPIYLMLCFSIVFTSSISTAGVVKRVLTGGAIVLGAAASYSLITNYTNDYNKGLPFYKKMLLENEVEQKSMPNNADLIFPLFTKPLRDAKDSIESGFNYFNKKINEHEAKVKDMYIEVQDIYKPN